MKTLAKLALATTLALGLYAAAAFAGPGPHDPPTLPEVPTAIWHGMPAPRKAAECDHMTVNTAPKLGGPAVVACTKAIKDTPACKMACR